MNTFLSLSNFIKENLSDDWMTPSQRETHDKLIEALSYHNYINLYGAVGIGKTFLGWLLHKNQIGRYFSHWSDLKPVTKPVIVDNVSQRREDFRNLIKEVQLADIPKLIAISREPINDYVASVELDCQQVDLAKMADNFMSCGKAELKHVLSEAEGIDDADNLWEVFQLILADTSR